MNGKVADYQPAPRTCLGCGKQFYSQGPGNRICEKCAKVNQGRQSSVCEKRMATNPFPR